MEAYPLESYLGEPMNKAEKLHKTRVAELGCMVCRKNGYEPGPVTLHHLRKNGWGKGDYMTLIPLCHTHHQGAEGIHTLGVKAWEKIYGTQAELLAATLRLLDDYSK
jgi:hypothetical protein